MLIFSLQKTGFFRLMIGVMIITDQKLRDKWFKNGLGEETGIQIKHFNINRSAKFKKIQNLYVYHIGCDDEGTHFFRTIFGRFRFFVSDGF